MARPRPHRLPALLALCALAGCGASAPTMTPRQLCEKTEPLAEAWRVAHGQEASSPEKAAIAMEECEKRWTDQRTANATIYDRLSACIAPVTDLEGVEKCVMEHIPVQ